ncbi:MAG: hemopexin repeat-containing protein [Bacteroidota bacterium]
MRKANLIRYFLILLVCLISIDVYSADLSLIKPQLTTSTTSNIDFMKDVDASFATNHKVYVFKGDEYVRCDKQSGYIDFGYPKKIAKEWPGLFKNIDAAIYRNGLVYFFKGEKYIRWNMNKSNMDSGYPKITKDYWKGLNVSSFDAAVNWDDERIYFFKGDSYYRYSWGDDKVSSGYPRKIKDEWSGLFENGINAALPYPKYGYFFKGGQYSRYNRSEDKVDAGYPRNFSAGWDFTPQKQPKTLFIYFNGTDRTIEGQLAEFANTVNADAQIYVKGVGASMKEEELYNYSSRQHGSYIRSISEIKYFSRWRKNVISELSWNPKSWAEVLITEANIPIYGSPIRKNDYYCNINIFERSAGTYTRRSGDKSINRSFIYGLNKRYVGNFASGYSSRDSEMAAKDVLKLLKYLNYDEIEPFDKIVITGHSRGAAVGIPSLLYAIKKANEGNSPFKDYQEIVKKVFKRAKQINIVALDPVAGQTGNTYHMGDWNTGEIYDYMNRTYSNITFNEIYANAAPMEVGIRVSNFNPARKYLHNPPSSSNLSVNRYWLGFRHSAMVNLDEKGNEVYDKGNVEKPSLMVSDFLNAALNNQTSFNDSSYWKSRFKDNDQGWYSTFKSGHFTNSRVIRTLFSPSFINSLDLTDVPEQRHRFYQDNDGKTVFFEDFVGSKGIF